jgi:hypothetical protein
MDEVVGRGGGVEWRGQEGEQDKKWLLISSFNGTQPLCGLLAEMRESRLQRGAGDRNYSTIGRVHFQDQENCAGN